MTKCGFMDYNVTIFFILIFVLICWLYNVGLDVGRATPLVRIKNGTLQGSIMVTRKGREIEAFRGIPYAQPPIGELRFEPPVPFDSWMGVRRAQRDPNFCIQRDESTAGDAFIGSENCLYLNVYRPKSISREMNGYEKKYTVMIWLHGGGFKMGSSRSNSYGPQFLLDHPVILVTVNYRLGALGFLSTADLVSPGNQGLKDQAQAIRWVHENIAAFNGDPKSVTLCGDSAGAASVHYHMISPHVRGLFHRAITLSGDAMAPWALIRPAIAKTESIILGELLDCPTEDSSTLVGCLKKKNAFDIVAKSCHSQVFLNCSLRPFIPVIEPDHPGAYINDEPSQSLKSGKVANVPWMTGINSQDGAYKVAGIYGLKDQPYTEILDKHFFELAPKSLLYDDTCFEELKYNVTKKIREFYLANKKIDESTRWNLLDMYTDALFYISSQICVKYHLKTIETPVYYYYFAYRGTSSFSTIAADVDNDCGVAHSDELQYLFPVSDLLFPNATMTKEDYRISEFMTKLLINFAKSGYDTKRYNASDISSDYDNLNRRFNFVLPIQSRNPTPKKTSQIPIIWEPVRTPSLQYIHIINSTNVHMAEDLFPERVNFWASIPYRSKIECKEEGYCGDRANARPINLGFDK